MRLALIGSDQLAIGGGKFLGRYHGLCSSTQEFGSAGSQGGGKLIQSPNKLVVELDKHFTSSHGHMVTHMVTTYRSESMIA